MARLALFSSLLCPIVGRGLCGRLGRRFSSSFNKERHCRKETNVAGGRITGVEQEIKITWEVHGRSPVP